jgi:hypothetical protein
LEIKEKELMDKTRPVIQTFSKSWKSRIVYLILSLVEIITLYEIGFSAITPLNQSFQSMESNSLSCNSCGEKIDPDPTFSLIPDKLLNDPRVHINPKPSGDTRFEPENKTALYISPFETGRLIAKIGKTGDFAWEGIEKILVKNGYRITILRSEMVTVKRLIDYLRDMKDPGIVVINTHGLCDGRLATGEMLTMSDDSGEAEKGLEEVKEHLIKYGHKKLIEMEGVDKMLIERSWFVAIKPAFWQYVQELYGRPVSFRKSLFYNGACYSDCTPDLRNRIRARAYFAWKTTVHPIVSGAFCLYLISVLDRPTHSAEEAYYNLVRVINTRKMIYKQDKLLEGKGPSTQIFPKSSFEKYLFNGYAYEGRSPVRYAGNGWLSPQLVNVEQVWWLVFAGRWGQDTQMGAENLKDCYNKYWASKKLGRLKSPFCNNANAGKPPKKDEVAYAIYLLTGDKDVGFSGTYVPRWTLNESQKE